MFIPTDFLITFLTLYLLSNFSIYFTTEPKGRTEFLYIIMYISMFVYILHYFDLVILYKNS